MVKVEANVSIMNNLTMDRLPLFNESELYTENDGLAMKLEWDELTQNIKYGNMRQVMSEDLIDNLCLDNAHCKGMSGFIEPNKNYDFSLLSIPTASEVQANIERRLKMNFWEKIVIFVEKNTAYICLFTLLFQSLLIIFTLIDFCSGNEQNVIKIFLSLLVKLLQKMATFFCKINTFSFLKRKGKNDFEMTTYNPNAPYTEEDEIFIQQPQPPENENFIQRTTNKKNLISSIKIP